MMIVVFTEIEIEMMSFRGILFFEIEIVVVEVDMLE